LLILVGATIVVLAIFADKLGYGDPGRLGVGQLLLALAGLVVALTGLLGKRILELYRGVAILLLNTLVLLAILELGAIVIARGHQAAESAGIEKLPYYAAQDWTEVYWREAKLAENYRYKPYVGWRHLPFAGETVNINQEGIRKTPGAECNDGAFKVFALGGSTMLGWGSPDWGTIAAYLQSGLDERTARPVCVVNLAEDGFVSTQSLIAVVLQLQSGNIPDAVIFYDGVNEVQAAYESGQPRAHVTQSEIAARFEQREHPLVRWLQGSRQYALMRKQLGKLMLNGADDSPNQLSYRVMGIDADDLEKSVVEIYLENYRIVDALGQQYGFQHFFFLQPHPAVSKKPLTAEEQIFKSGIDPALADLAQKVYADVSSVASDYENLWYLVDVFDGERAQIWIDKVGHLTPEGNRLVAQEILAVVENQLAEK
jgi:lysophospholipase L1-like esterase